MDILNPAELKSLLARQGKWCVSLYMPTHRMGRDQQQDPIRLKNLLAQAETKLIANGLRRPEVQKLMRPAEELLYNSSFWQHQGDGLAIFLSNEFSAVYRLPAEFEELLVTGHSFHIKPLMSLFGRIGKFYVLALSLNSVRLYQGTSDSLSEVTLNFPTSMSEALWMDEPQNYLSMHPNTVSMNPATSGPGIFHGHTAEDEEKENISRFFQAVNQGINNLIEDKTVPMILAGVESHVALYRESNTYQNTLKDSVSGNPDREQVKELHAEAWNIVRPIFEESQKKAYEKFQQLSGQQSALATQDLTKAVKASTFGQMETLFVPMNTQIWGRYDADNNKVIVDSEPRVESEDLLDFAAAQTILNSGQVFAVPREQMPGDGDLAAILRYDVPPP